VLDGGQSLAESDWFNSAVMPPQYSATLRELNCLRRVRFVYAGSWSYLGSLEINCLSRREVNCSIADASR
jgi:hypothetical protein